MEGVVWNLNKSGRFSQNGQNQERPADEIAQRLVLLRQKERLSGFTLQYLKREYPIPASIVMHPTAETAYVMKLQPGSKIEVTQPPNQAVVHAGQ